MITLNSLESLKNQKIDFISIDTEGNEFDIISSMNFVDLDVETIVIENNYKDERIKEFLSGFDFLQLYKLDFDDVYINKKYLSFSIRFRLKIWKLNIFSKRVKNKLMSFTK